LHVPGDETEQQVHTDATGEHDQVGRSDGGVAQQPDVNQRVVPVGFEHRPRGEQ
jgi:hypothetical protein